MPPDLNRKGRWGNVSFPDAEVLEPLGFKIRRRRIVHFHHWIKKTYFTFSLFCFRFVMLYFYTMAQGKFTENLVRLRCGECKKLNYFKHKNKKAVEGKLELKKYCEGCRKHTLHKESKK